MATLTSWEYFEDLRKSGLSEEQSLSQAKALDKSLCNLATKDDLKRLELITKDDINGVKGDLKRLDSDLKDVKSDIRRCLYSMVAGVIVLTFKTIFHW